MIQKILVPAIILLITGCSQNKCKEIHHDRKSGIEVCMKDSWKIGEEAFANFTIEKDELRVKVIAESPSSDPPYDIKKIWKTQCGVVESFNKPCEPLGDDKSIVVDGAEGWIGTTHLIKTAERPEYYETIVMVIHNGREYFIDSRCKAADKAKNIQLVEEVCANLSFNN